MPVEPMPRFHPAIRDGKWYVSDSRKGGGVSFIITEAFSGRDEALAEATKMNEEQNA